MRPDEELPPFGRALNAVLTHTPITEAEPVFALYEAVLEELERLDRVDAVILSPQALFLMERARQARELYRPPEVPGGPQADDEEAKGP